MPSTRRAFLTAGAGGLAALAGCTGSTTPAESPSDSPSDTAVPAPGDDDDRHTQTPRDPTPLDVSGAWRQRGFDAGHGGVTAATGVPDDGEAYWQLRRVRSGPAVVADGRLFHYGSVGADAAGTPTETQTPPTGTSQPLVERPALFCRDARDGRVLWTRRLPHRGSHPTVVDGYVVAAGEGFVAAHRVDDGREAWRHDLGERHASASTAVDGTVLAATQFVREGDREADVRAYRASDGARRWTRSSPKQQARLAASNDAVLALSSRFQVGSVLTARSLADGSERWSVDIDDNGIPGGPVVAGGAVYVTPDDDGVYAFDLADGAERWHYEAETSNRVGLAADADAAYLVDVDGLSAVDAGDGSDRWSVSPEGDRRYGGVPAVGREAVYVEKSGFPADLVALDRDDGSERWSYRLPETVVGGDMVTSGLVGQPSVVDGAVYAFAEDGLYAFGPAGD